MSVLWVLVEGKSRVHKLRLEDGECSLSDMHDVFCEKIPFLQKLKNKSNGVLEPFRFVHYSERFKYYQDDIFVKNIDTSHAQPLVIRYIISDDVIAYNLKFDDKSFSSSHMHETSLWHILHKEAEERFADLKGETYEFYLNDALLNEETLNAIVLDIEPNRRNIRKMDFVIKLKGKKIFSQWKLKEALQEAVNKSKLEELSSFKVEGDIEIDDGIFDSMISELKRKKLAFVDVDSNEATYREFISAFLTAAVQQVKKNKSSLNIRLFAEENLKGKKAYGIVDYIIKILSYVICVTEAKQEDMKQGCAQNIMQMLSALQNLLESFNDDGTLSVYGVVTTAIQWRFFEWKDDELKVSDTFICSFDSQDNNQKMRQEARKILEFLIYIIKKQAENVEHWTPCKKFKGNEQCLKSSSNNFFDR